MNDSIPTLKISMTLASDQLSIFFPLLQQGLQVKTNIGSTIMTMLCEHFGVGREYVEGRIKTIFLDGKPVDDVWDIPIINPLAKERTDYPTQKPEKLLERIISALSTEGDIVMDIFSGSGTTAVAARALGRRFVCCDNNPDAIKISLKRLEKCPGGTEKVSIIM